MKEIRTIVAKYDELRSKGIRTALATVVHVEDSSYRRSGARMLIAEDGTWTGGISGGCLEGDTLLKAKHVINEQRPTVVRYDTREDDPDQIGVGLGCNGLIDVLIAPISDEDNPIETLRSVMDTREPRVGITVIRSATDRLSEGKFTLDSMDGAQEYVQSVLQTKKSRAIETSGGDRLFLEYLAPSIHLFVFGKNYDTIPLVRIAREVGWITTIVANISKVSKEVYHLADHVYDSRKDLPPMDSYSICLLMAHDYRTDLGNLLRLHDRGLPYLGLLGPRKRFEKMLSEPGVKETDIDLTNIFAPIGLDTGATTPEEIAISIIAEIRAHMSERDGGRLRDRITRIHD